MAGKKTGLNPINAIRSKLNCIELGINDCKSRKLTKSARIKNDNTIELVRSGILKTFKLLIKYIIGYRGKFPSMKPWLTNESTLEALLL
jgi:hypothetical protein